VRVSASRIASALVEARVLGSETVPLGEYAGELHDDIQDQGPGANERLSAEKAAAWMRAEAMPERYVQVVMKMIAGTEVLRIEGTRIVQAADPEDPEQALLADADLSSLGMRKGLHRALLLNLEQQHQRGLIRIPPRAQGILIEPNREATLGFLRFQVGLYNDDRYLLGVSRRLFPHVAENRDETARLLDLYQADRISWPQMLTYAKRLALGEPGGRAFVAEVHAPAAPSARAESSIKAMTIVVVDIVNSVATTAPMGAAEQYQFAAALLGLFQGVGEST
jgi:hypothetical protein